MNATDIKAFVRNIEPVCDLLTRCPCYRVSATLNDGLVLPCVVIIAAAPTVELAIERFHDTRKSKDPYMGYRSIVKNFVASGNSINADDIESLQASPYAIPKARMRAIVCETSMGWTEFYAQMKDGNEFRFGTPLFTEFFAMPEGYSGDDIVKIIPAVRGQKPRCDKIYYDRPFFKCYVDAL